MDPTVEVASTGPNAILWVGLGSLSCIGTVLLMYNLFVLVGMLRSKDEESASGLSKAAWGTSLLALFTGPFCGWFLALVAIVMARVETGRVYRDESTLASATPARMASLNGGMLFLLLVIGAVSGFLGFS